MTVRDLFTRRDPVLYDISKIEQGDLVKIGFPGASFWGLVREEPRDFTCKVILKNEPGQPSEEMEVPASLILAHRERGQWHEGRQAA